MKIATRYFAPICLVTTIGFASTAIAQTAKKPIAKTPSIKAPIAKIVETVGGGDVINRAIGPAPSFELGGKDMVLVKNWQFGADGTIKNIDDMNAHFYYHDQFGTINNGGKYGSKIVAPDAINATSGQPIEGINSPKVREFTPDSLKTFVTPLDKTTTVKVSSHNAGNGSFMAKWRLPKGGSLLGRDIVWETRVRMKTPKYFWFALWTAGNKWKWNGQAQGAEHDLVESFGYDNGGGNTNYDGRFWHSNSVADPRKDEWNFWDWEKTMKERGIQTFDATQYHIWTWVYRKDNSFDMYADGVRVQGGKNYFWTFGNGEKDEPIDMDFLFDGGWGHNQIGSVNKEMDASEFDGKFYEWDYSRVYLSGDGQSAKNGPHPLPGTIKASDYNIGDKGIAFDQNADGSQWRKYSVKVAQSGRYNLVVQLASPTAGGKFHIEDENGNDLTGPQIQASTLNKDVTTTIPITLKAGGHTLKWVQSENVKISSISLVKIPGPTATFVKTDNQTQGSWKSVYGADGYLIAGDATKMPTYANVKRNGWEARWNGNGETSDVRAPQKANGNDTQRVAGQWGTNDPFYEINCDFSDGAMHQVALYGLDWDRNGRSMDIEVLDAQTGGVLDTYDLNAYVNGKYVVWNVSGHVIFRLRNTGRWTNPAMSGIFFDAVANKEKAAKKVS